MLVKRNMDEMITHFNDVVSAMYISIKDKMTILGMITAIGYEYQEAADAIEKLQKQVEDYECRLEISPEAEYAIDKHCNDIISRMDKLIKGLDDKPRWIPVTERLPEEDKLVLVWRNNGLPYVSRRIDSSYWVGLGRDAGVAHWMPLPEPPKEET